MQANEHNDWIFDVTASDFDARVVKAEVPVLVDFWAPWCGPCKQIAPMLESLAARYAGRLHIAKVNVDEESTLASGFNVRSIPMLALFSGGKLVEQVVGVQPETALSELIDKHVSKAPGGLRNAVQDALAAGDHQGALLLLEQAQQDEPEDAGIMTDIARCQLALDLLDEATASLAGLPANIAASHEIITLKNEIALAKSASELRSPAELEQLLAAQPNDLSLQLELAQAAAAQRDYSKALELFMSVMKTDREFRDGAGREGLLVLFDILGSSDERVQTYRRQMATLLH